MIGSEALRLAIESKRQAERDLAHQTQLAADAQAVIADLRASFSRLLAELGVGGE